MSIVSRLQKRRQRRTWRVRNVIRKTSVDRARLSVFRSNKHIYVHVIDDLLGMTLVSVCTTESALRELAPNGGNADAARCVGKIVGERCLAKGISEVVFDRGSYKYHGRVAAVAEAAREAGLNF